jgi:DNA helicase-2/ATP-dependent DNA helicase PcrA
MHSAKGLEFPVVFIVGMDEGLFPRIEGRHSLAEERRLFYVALTRAMRVVVLSRATWRTREAGPVQFARSPFVREIPHHLLRPIGAAEDIATSWLEPAAASAPAA